MWNYQQKYTIFQFWFFMDGINNALSLAFVYSSYTAESVDSVVGGHIHPAPCLRPQPLDEKNYLSLELEQPTVVAM